MDSNLETPIDAVGTIFVRYDPCSPVSWGMVPFNLNVSVYADVAHALVAFKRALRGRPQREFSSLFFRGQGSVSMRLLPTRLRDKAPWPVLDPKDAISIDPRTPPEIRRQIHHVQGTWHRREKRMRSMPDLPQYLPDALVQARDESERACILAAQERFPEIKALDPFRQRAAVRHYGDVDSSLMDVTTDPEVAAFFASWTKKDLPEERYGMLWAVDIGQLAELFKYEVIKVPGGEKILLTDQRELWGSNAEFFKDQELPPIQIEIVNVDLPLSRPTAQRGRFLSLAGIDGRPLPVKAELIWWSMIERWSSAVAFLQTGERYENLQADVTEARLLPTDDPYLGIKQA